MNPSRKRRESSRSEGVALQVHESSEQIRAGEINQTQAYPPNGQYLMLNVVLFQTLNPFKESIRPSL